MRPMTIPEIIEAVNQRVEEFRQALIADIQAGVVETNTSDDSRDHTRGQ
jgi:hypothetical protein